MKTRIGLGVWLAAIMLAAIAQPSIAAARDYEQIVRPFYERHGTYKKVRSALRKQLERDRVLPADAYFTLATTCEIEPPKGPSIIMNALEKSPCKKEAADYYLEAGRGGLPLGFLRAARLQGKSDAAFVNGQLAYQFAGADKKLRGDALELLAYQLDGAPYNVAADQRAQVAALRLVDLGIYPAAGPTADLATLRAELRETPIPPQFHGRWVVGFGIKYNRILNRNDKECKENSADQYMIIDRRNVYRGDEEPKRVFDVRILGRDTIEMKNIHMGKPDPFGFVLTNGGVRMMLVGPGHNGVPFFKCSA